MSQPRKLRIVTTQAPRRSFPLPYSPYSFFTGDLFDRIVLFLHKHNTAFTSIECVARGIDKASALADGPTICICVIQDGPDAGGVGLFGEISEERGGDIKVDTERGGIETEGRREAAAVAPSRESGADKPEGAMDGGVAGKEEEAGKSGEGDEQEKTEKKDSVEGSVEPQRRDHGQNEDALESEKNDEGNPSNDKKDEPIPPCERNPGEDQDIWQEKKPDSTKSLVKLALETKPQNLDKKQDAVLQTAKQKTSAYISGIAKLFCESEVAHTIPPEILTIEFVSVIVHEDSKVGAC